MTTLIKRPVLLFSILFISLLSGKDLSAQSIDIGLFPSGPDTLEVRLRSDFTFDTLITNVQFSIRWDAASGAHLGAIKQDYPQIVFIPMQKSGPEADDNGYRYQVFFGTASFPMSQFGAGFTPGVEIVLFRIPLQSGCSDIAVVNDSWTGSVMNNGDYFVSLNARNRTGIIYSSIVQTCQCSDVTVNQGYSICQGDSIFLGGEYQFAAGTYYDTLTKNDGCDSIVESDLTVRSNSIINNPVSICDGEAYLAGGSLQTQTGTYYDTFAAANGCDSIFITSLTVIPPTVNNTAVAICDGDSLFAGGAWQTQAGNYSDTLVSSQSCDSISIIQLSIRLSVLENQSDTINEGDSLFAGGGFQTQSGVYYDTLMTAGGCDSIVITDLTVIPAISVQEIAINGMGFQAYPNPFKEAVTIEFVLPEAGEVRLEVITMDGRKAAVLFEESAEANKVYKTHYSGQNTGGIYFLRLTTESGIVQTRKLVSY